MTTVYAGTTPTSYPATTRVLVGSDEQLASNYNACYQDLRDAANFLNAERVRIVNQVRGLATSTQWIDIQAGLAVQASAWSRHTTDVSGRPYWLQGENDDTTLWFDATPWLPRTGTIVQAQVWVTGPGSTTFLPDTLPKLVLRRVAKSASSTDAGELIVEQEDPSSVEQYKTHHMIEAVPGSPHEISDEYIYTIGLRGPKADNPEDFRPNFRVDGLQITLGAVT